ncbi:PREDICTED: probable LRR receptor-like serine/threonine-protein kinase At1g05700 isoform X2 [Lupinus angustifolius]|uniref:probable LRR receptor-like serine/threonine-protein kinase At1g05700 isoform X2 n=1 Tax=Lupinus angustifolius TaxID=3871 RepID=UPI00092E9B13|nr:PREDICTED: probable LRR receptor-like serine/threonine-protein kinase At1g05700 isoform X2 [Lupinus angustifolius]
MIKMLLHYLLVLLRVLTMVVLIQAQDQSGFISIDCGLPKSATYTEPTIGINYISDDKFISSGVSVSLLPSERSNLQQQLWHVRSFPNGVRNCYRINVTSGTKYLIRADFYYGNYDGLNEVPIFDLHIGANPWDTMKFPNASLSSMNEIIYTAPLDFIHLCLVNTGQGTPFISSIELRALENKTYGTESGSLDLLIRYDLGSTSGSTYRFSDDVYDRIWMPTVFNLWTQVSTSLSNDNLTQNAYKPPAIVMSTAATPINSSAAFVLYWDPENVNIQYKVYMHFNEVQKLKPNETRSFNITLNGEHWYGPMVPSYQMTSTIFSPLTLTGATRYVFSLFKTETSTLPPIINAIEIYIVKDLSQQETEQDDVDAITNIKNTYGVDRNWQGDPCAPIAYMWQGLNCSSDGDKPPRITYLDLSSSGMTGQIPFYISKLTMLQYLDLSNNSLSGAIPDFLTQMQLLKVLNLGNNKLNGSVPSGLVDRSEKGSLSLSVGKNLNLCASASCNQANQQTDNQIKKKNKTNIVIPVVVSVAGVLVLLVIASVSIIKRKPRAAVKNHVGTNTLNISQLKPKQREYSYEDLVKITNNLDRLLGGGGFGPVYHGFIDDIEVAVKILSQLSVRGYQQFLAEVELLMIVHHKNLTSLVGYCNEEGNIGLIYEYMANGNLDEYLSGENIEAKLLTWEDRLRIAIDAAQGLEYLHNGCKPPIIHRDVKCTNILLNENLQAKMADFGLSKSFPTDGKTHLSTVVAGTHGYMDPDYFMSNRLTEKSDVYSFGVVILVIITGQPANRKMHDDYLIHISQWVSPMFSNGDIENIVDSKLEGDFDTNSVRKAVKIAMDCLSTNSSKRPNMSEVVTELKNCFTAELARKRTGHDTDKSSELVPLNRTTKFGPLLDSTS